MKFFLDENIPYSSAVMLDALGHEVSHAGKTDMKGCDDKKIAEHAAKNKAVLVSKDLEFGNVLLYPEGSHYGVMIIRFPYDLTGKQITENLKEFVKNIDVKDLVGHLTILELGRYRTRKI